jgi:hypothetical protein
MPAQMGGDEAQVGHDQFRPVKDRGVKALQDKVRFAWGLQSYQEGIINIALPIFPEVQDSTRKGELLSRSNKMVQSSTLGIFSR